MCIVHGKSKLGIHSPKYCWPTGWSLIIGNNTQARIGIDFQNLSAVTFMDRQRIALEVQSIMTTLETMMMIYILKFHWWFSKTRTQITQFVRISPGRSKLGIHPQGNADPQAGPWFYYPNESNKKPQLLTSTVTTHRYYKMNDHLYLCPSYRHIHKSYWGISTSHLVH